MEIRTQIDSVGAVEGIFSNLFFSLFPQEDARMHFGYSKISPVIGRRGLPGWYLWFQGKQGSFKLELLGNLPDPEDPRNAFTEEPIIGSQMVIRYYPSEEESILDSYSCYEQMVRLSSLFDHTGTPTVEGTDHIRDSFFTVGFLNVRTDLSRSFLELECVAPERWIDYRSEGVYLKNGQESEFEAVPPGGLDRDVPGWVLSHQLFDKIMLGLGYVYRASPISVFLSKERAFTFTIDGNNRVTKQDAAELSQFHLIVAFETSRTEAAKIGPQLYKESVRRGLQLANLKLLGEWDQPPFKANWINPDWWWTKEMTFSGPTAFHCCGHDH